MSDRGLVVIGASAVRDALDGNEDAVLDAVAEAYLAHGAGRTVLPHSLFLRFGEDDPNRIIALPAFLDDARPVAGLKWIASFPGNVPRGLDRASAVLIVNSTETGRPAAVVESSLVSARRTAASAALAAREIHRPDETHLGLIGCGVINFEITRLERAVLPNVSTLVLHDLRLERAEAFARRVEADLDGMDCQITSSPEDVFRRALLVSLATIAGAPHIHSAAGWSDESTVLHVSLRDLAPAVIREVDNVVDDTDHVVRARTSLHLTEMEDGHREFIRCTLANILAGKEPPRAGARPVVFSPFGLGVLDLAVARLVLDHARSTGAGTWVEGFLPGSWSRT